MTRAETSRILDVLCEDSGFGAMLGQDTCGRGG